jgi:hypothetical protein
METSGAAVVCTVQSIDCIARERILEKGFSKKDFRERMLEKECSRKNARERMLEKEFSRKNSREIVGKLFLGMEFREYFRI